MNQKIYNISSYVHKKIERLFPLHPKHPLSRAYTPTVFQKNRMSEVTRETIIESFKALSLVDQWDVMEFALKTLKNTSKPTKMKKVRDPNAPKKEATWWVKRTCEVRDHLKEVISEENLCRKSRGENALPAIAAVRVASMLRKAGKLTQDVMPSHEDILATWATFLVSPPEPNPKPVKEPKATAVKKVLTEEEKAAKKEKAAAKKAVPPPPSEPVDEQVDEAVDEAEEVAPYEWTFDFGKGAKVYERLDHDGKAFIYDNETKEYLGLFMEKLKKLNKSHPDPLA